MVYSNIHTMKFRSLLKPIVALTLLATACAAIYAGARHSRDGAVPILCQVNPTHPKADQQVTITVQLDSNATADTVATLGCTDPYAYSYLPTSITIPAGQNSASATATTSASYISDPIMTATVNTVSVLSNGAR
jgi:hypothetical protein